MPKQQSVERLNYFFSKYKPKLYNKRTVIPPSYDFTSSVFYIKEGYLRVFRISEHGVELTITILKSTDLFPFIFNLKDLQLNKTYYFEALTQVIIWKIHTRKFYKFLRNNPDIYSEIINDVLIGYNDTLSKLENFVFNDAYTNIIASIISCAKKFGKLKGDDILLTVPLTHKDIAALVGITRETTSLEMKKLEKQGYISRLGRYLLIKNIKKLEYELMMQTGSKSPYSYSLKNN